ncbi:MAG: hypothetical protein K0R82_1996 [Flavipsychrobacter sp.]|jgi:O-antigen ligase|nr:hypothetical protein [Flavipsychrobacter sp.]
MLNVGWFRPLQLVLLYCLAFLIPFPYIYTSVAVISLTVAWFLGGDPKQTWHNLKTRKALWAWLAYFALFALSYFYSNNKSHALFDIQLKLAFVFLPLAVGAGINLKRPAVENIFLAFVAGISVAALTCIIPSLRIYMATGESKVLFYENLVHHITDIHAVHMAWFTLFSLSALLLFPWQRFSGSWWRFARLALIGLQTAFFILLSSKTLIVLFFLIITPIYLKKTLKARYGGVKVALLALSAIVLLAALALTDNPLRGRYKDVIVKNDLEKAFLEDYRDVDESRLSNLTIRVFSWRIGLENIRDNNLWLTGCGSGDWQDLQNRKFANYHVQNWDKTYFDNTSELYNINLHNMFLQSFIMIGLPGLLLCCIIILSPFFYIKKLRYGQLFFIFHLAAFAFMMQESALQTQAGIIYYCFFTQIFWNIYYTGDLGKNMQSNISKSEKV